MIEATRAEDVVDLCVGATLPTVLVDETETCIPSYVIDYTTYLVVVVVVDGLLSLSKQRKEMIIMGKQRSGHTAH